MKIIVGLGNPGPRYDRTRHNVGFQCVDHFSRLHQIPLDSRREHAVLGTGTVEGVPVVLAKPRTFMNESGVAVSYLVRRFNASPSDLIVVYDDLDLPPGRIRIRQQGSAGGHNGMKSIIQALGSQEVPRIRVGIGRPGEGDQIKHVLSTFGREEQPLIEQAIEQAAGALLSVLTEGLAQAMNRFN
ncbi:MAG: aminoacyl-tRNA hydrolase [Dehalococcoidia bacterium]|nr:aminoacyl-tRNA hydrolase [Dehalococcoidia bacterium]